MTEDPGQSGPQILLLEDEWLIAEATARSLKRLGYRALGPAHSVAEAFELLDQQRPDGVLIDTILKGESSLAVADRLIESGIPFAFYSGFDQADLPPRFAGCRMFRKPVGEAALKSGLAAMLGGRGQAATTP